MIRLKHKPKSLQWGIRSIALSAVTAAVAVVILTFIMGNGSFYNETAVSLAIISIMLFLFMTFGLYRGIQLKREKKLFSLLDYADPSVDFPIEIFDLGDFFWWITVAVVVIVMSFFLWSVFFWVLAALTFIFYRALRLVFVKRRFCQGNLRLSAGTAFLYTLLYTGWLFAILAISAAFRMN